jgi:7-carboxy-7-deazaguanine synthase
MSYFVKEIFYSLQGEGANCGRPTIFCRFSGCNLWTGREADRQSAVCQFCDTNFMGTDGLGGGSFATPEALAQAIREFDASVSDGTRQTRPLVVFTGGEPLLQLDDALIRQLPMYEVAVETNGTRAAPAGIDWICVSPKANTQLVLRCGHELKLVYPQAGLQPESFEDLDFEHFLLQPMDGPNLQEHIRLAIEYCLAHPRWRLSLQTHKILGLR